MPLTLGGEAIARGARRTIRLPVAPLYTHTEMTMPVHVVRGQQEGPRLFVSAAVHGDEINGTEIVRQLLAQRQLRRLRGTLFAVPVVNVYGYTARTRYLPDRRDLNRSFPGSPSGSMAARLAHVFMEEIVGRCTHGLDLHTGAVHRTNLPHVRVGPEQTAAHALARAFGVPLILHADLRDGSLRQAVAERGLPMLLYEAGEALRFDRRAIRAGLRGVLAVMRALGMLPPLRGAEKEARRREPLVARRSTWVRAPASGTLLPRCEAGDVVTEGDALGVLTDPLGEEETPVLAPATGVIVGQTTLPLVHEGEALFNIARTEETETATQRLGAFEAALAGEG